jgi:hypothetical protein
MERSGDTVIQRKDQRRQNDPDRTPELPQLGDHCRSREALLISATKGCLQNSRDADASERNSGLAPVSSQAQMLQ